MALGSVSEWLKEAASKTVDRVKAVRRFESCRFRITIKKTLLEAFRLRKCFIVRKTLINTFYYFL